MPTGSARRNNIWRLAAMLLLVASFLAACSVNSSNPSGINLSLGLAGSTADHPAKPPVIGSGGPSGTFAFVYDNQVWVSSGSSATQLTHLVLSNGSTIAWGPLLWSPDGTYIAFALAQSTGASTTMATSGTIYYVNATTGATVATVATGSIYGHNYTWYGNDFLVYSSGAGISMYGPISTGNPRVWTVLSPFDNTGTNAAPDGGFLQFGDLAITNQNVLFFTRLDLTSLGVSANAGSAAVDYIQMPLLPTDITSLDLANSYPLPLGNISRAVDLGQVYTGPSGLFTTGAWQISRGGSYLVWQKVTGVDARTGTVTSTYCASAARYYVCNQQLFTSATKTSSGDPANISISPDGTAASFTSNGLYVQNVDGSGSTRLASAGWLSPATWSPDSKTVAVTRLNKATTDANGVTHFNTDVVLFGGGAKGSVFIAGAQNLAWQM